MVCVHCACACMCVYVHVCALCMCVYVHVYICGSNVFPCPTESSSYGGDSEDSDWAPPAPGGREEDSVEDMADLVADAKAFISNKKMRKPV